MLPAACCALLSVRRNLHETDARFFLLGIGLGAGALESVKAFSRMHGIEIECLAHSADVQTKKTAGRWPAATMARLYMDTYLSPDIDRLLFIDADVLAFDTVDDLFRLELGEADLAAVDDYLMAFPEKIQKRLEKIGMSRESHYFNAGVLLFDWRKCLERRYLEKARSIYEARHGVFDANDQDVLNIVFENRWLRLDPRWNTQTGFLPAVARPAIVHFTGRKKPWQKAVTWPHRIAKQRYMEDLGGLPWSRFVKPSSSIDMTVSLAAHIGQTIGGAGKAAKVRRYFANRP